MKPPVTICLLSIVVCCLSACQTTQQRLLDSDTSQVQLRSVQSRVFDTADRKTALRTIIATLQDLDFVIDEADAVLGLVSATKQDEYELLITVTVRARGERQSLVRANLQFKNRPVRDPTHYQQFFTALEKAMFITAQQVE